MLCLEADSWAFHSSPGPFVDDRDRDRELFAIHGFWTQRIPYRDATRRPARVRGQIRGAAERLAGVHGVALAPLPGPGTRPAAAVRHPPSPRATARSSVAP